MFTRVRQLNIAGALKYGVVRSFTLATRARHGFGPIRHHYGDAYIGWPADFYMGNVKVLATDIPQGRFRSVVKPLAARLMQDQKTTCTGS